MVGQTIIKMLVPYNTSVFALKGTLNNLLSSKRQVKDSRIDIMFNAMNTISEQLEFLACYYTEIYFNIDCSSSKTAILCLILLK
jgi:hypothetical protein